MPLTLVLVASYTSCGPPTPANQVLVLTRLPRQNRKGTKESVHETNKIEKKCGSLGLTKSRCCRKGGACQLLVRSSMRGCQSGSSPLHSGLFVLPRGPRVPSKTSEIQPSSDHSPPLSSSRAPVLKTLQCCTGPSHPRRRWISFGAGRRRTEERQGTCRLVMLEWDYA
jgi:hypothetical protein